MENLDFSKLNEFNARETAKKLSLELYLKELGIKDFLYKVALKLESYDVFFFQPEHYPSELTKKPNASYSRFTSEFEQEFLYGTGEEINYIVGIPGIGKSQFFKHGVKVLFRSKTEVLGKYQEYCVHFKNIEQKMGIEYYKSYIYKTLKERAIDFFKEDYNDYDRFVSEYKHYTKDDSILGETPYSKLFPTMFFCKFIYEKYGQPAIITFDDIDLSCETTQEQIRNAVASVHDELFNLMRSKRGLSWFRIFFVMRPETIMHTIEERKGRRINFPYPDVLQITLDKLYLSVKETEKELEADYGSFGGSTLIIESVIDGCQLKCNSIGDVAKYFISIMEHFLLEAWKRDDIINRLGTNQEFHCHLVNYNVRTFLSFISDTLKDGGFKPFTERFVKTPDVIYTVYDYLEMLICGRWAMHPGNRIISKEGRNFAPIVFNVFEVAGPSYDESIETQIKHFTLNLRIMQLLFYIDDETDCEYRYIRENLKLFFEESRIMNATKKLIQVGILYSHAEGEKSVRSKKRYADIILQDDNCLSISDMGRFYLKRLICEFEYMYQMALSSLMMNEHIALLKSQDIYLYEKEETVYYFLDSMYHIIAINYKLFNDECKQKYKDIFQVGQIYIKMIDTFILAIDAKNRRAQKRSGEEKVEKFSHLSLEAKKLKNKALECSIF